MPRVTLPGSCRKQQRQLFARGQLRLHWLELDGRPAAAEFHLAGDGVVYGYQSGVDPDALEHEPGRIAAVATLQAAIADGYRAFDFMRGDEPYKAHWRAEAQPALEYRISAPRATSRLRQTAWIAAQSIKERLKAKGERLKSIELNTEH